MSQYESQIGYICTSRGGPLIFPYISNQDWHTLRSLQYIPVKVYCNWWPTHSYHISIRDTEDVHTGHGYDKLGFLSSRRFLLSPHTLNTLNLGIIQVQKQIQISYIVNFSIYACTFFHLMLGWDTTNVLVCLILICIRKQNVIVSEPLFTGSFCFNTSTFLSWLLLILQLCDEIW